MATFRPFQTLCRDIIWLCEKKSHPPDLTFSKKKDSKQFFFSLDLKFRQVEFEGLNMLMWNTNVSFSGDLLMISAMGYESKKKFKYLLTIGLCIILIIYLHSQDNKEVSLLQIQTKLCCIKPEIWAYCAVNAGN